MTLVLSTKSQPKDVLNGYTLNYYGGGAYVGCTLAPGEARLFTPNDNTTTMPDLTISNPASPFVSGFYAFELANNIQISNTTFNGAIKSFMGNHIRLSTGTKIQNNSRVRLKAYTNSNSTNPNGPSLAPKQKQADIPKEQITLTDPLVYPNPTRDNFIVKTSLKADEEIEIRVYDNVGRTINVTKAVNGETSISLGNQSTGIYFVRFTQNEKAYSYKIVKL